MLSRAFRSDIDVDVGSVFSDSPHLSLAYCDACQIWFFQPGLAGDAEFYRQLHQQPWYQPASKTEFDVATGHIRAGMRVLDIGCGDGRFGHRLIDAEYHGLEPGGELPAGAPFEYFRHSMAQHRFQFHGYYDVVTAFQVLEHLADPNELAITAWQCLKPGGTLVVGVPNMHTYLNSLSNFVLNSPPHHLTWWSAPGLRRYLTGHGFVVDQLHFAELEHWEQMLYRMARIEQCLPLRSDTRFHQGKRWRRVLAYVIARVLESGFTLRGKRGATMVAVAHKSVL